MKQRRKEPVVTRQAILDAAGVEFARVGYAATGLGGIVSRAGLTKGALFHHFADKTKLTEAWILGPLTAGITQVWITPLEAIGSLKALQGFCRTRCLELRPADELSALVLLTAETAAIDETLGGALEGLFAAWRAATAGLLERGKSEGWIHRSIQPEAEAAFLVATFCGFTVTTKASTDETSRRACASALEAYLETLRAQ